MTKSIDFYFDFISPYSYLAIHKLKALKNCEEININYKPILPVSYTHLTLPTIYSV